MILKTISPYLQPPPLYTKSKDNIWQDEHISRQLLKAHLDPDFEGASRRFSFMDASVKWMTQQFPASKYPRLLDLGCGPGLYAERFARVHYDVTGVDFSKGSIEYATQTAATKGLTIHYHHQDYLNLKIKGLFDIITLIYCDYGVLFPDDRKRLLRSLYDHLNPGGHFLLDVFSTAHYEAFEEKQYWEYCPEGGFWDNEAYLGMYGHYRYPNTITLEQSIICTETHNRLYYIWNHCFSPERLIEELQEAGFTLVEFFSDVAGKPYQADSSTIAMLLTK